MTLLTIGCSVTCLRLLSCTLCVIIQRDNVLLLRIIFFKYIFYSLPVHLTPPELQLKKYDYIIVSYMYAVGDYNIWKENIVLLRIMF